MLHKENTPKLFYKAGERMRRKQGTEVVGMAGGGGDRKGSLRRLRRTWALPAMQKQVWEVGG